MNKTVLYALVGLVILVLIGWAIYYFATRNSSSLLSTDYNLNSNSSPATVVTISPSTKTTTNEWQEVGPALAGTYADADIITLADGSYRMYAATQPEVAGNQLEIYSARSKDGITWTKEAGTRKTLSTFPDIVKLDDGTFRLNFQNAGVIKSATSKDGLKFTDETGTRIDKTNDQGMTFDNVAAPTTLKLADGTYLMAYRGTIKEAYAAETVPNKEMGVVMYATSTDGKTWTKKGLAIDTRKDTELKGWADGPELIDFDGEVRLYFSTYKGVYYSVFKDGDFGKAKFSWQKTDPTKPANTNDVFGGIPPGDPTLLKVNSVWYMYYGTHPQGIYYAKLSS